MVQINLLPWRERSRELKKKNFFVSLSMCIGFTLFVIFLFHMYYEDLIAYQDKRNAFLQSQLSEKQTKINEFRENKDQQELTKNKLRFLMGLRDKGYRAVRVLNDMLKIVPESITLTKLESSGNMLIIEGRAQSELAITAFLKRITEDSLFKQAVLTGINAQQEQGAERSFQIKVEKEASPYQEIAKPSSTPLAPGSAK